MGGSIGFKEKKLNRLTKAKCLVRMNASLKRESFITIEKSAGS